MSSIAVGSMCDASDQVAQLAPSRAIVVAQPARSSRRSAPRAAGRIRGTPPAAMAASRGSEAWCVAGQLEQPFPASAGPRRASAAAIEQQQPLDAAVGPAALEVDAGHLEMRRPARRARRPAPAGRRRARHRGGPAADSRPRQRRSHRWRRARCPSRRGVLGDRQQSLGTARPRGGLRDAPLLHALARSDRPRAARPAGASSAASARLPAASSADALPEQRLPVVRRAREAPRRRPRWRPAARPIWSSTEPMLTNGSGRWSASVAASW